MGQKCAPAEHLKAHAADIARLLADREWYLRRAALEVLSRISADALGPHAAEVRVLLDDEDEGVRDAAKRVCKLAESGDASLLA